MTDKQVLIVGYSPDDVETVREILLAIEPINIVRAKNLEEAIDLIQTNKIERVIVDSGDVQVLNNLKQIAKIQIITISSNRANNASENK